MATKIRTGQFNIDADFDFQSHKGVNVLDPTSAQDIATKNYVDLLAAGLRDVKQSVRVGTTANITLSGAQTIDGVSVIAGDRVLVMNQTTGPDNGIYVCASGAWSRATDANISADVTPGMFTFVEEGTANGDTGWLLTTNAPITLGSTSLVFAQFTGASAIIAGAGLTKSGNTIDVVAGDDSILVNANELHVQLKDASLETVSGGLRIKTGTNGDMLIQTAGAFATMPFATWIAAHYDNRVTPTGAVNGSNVTFTAPHTPVSGTDDVILNGNILDAGDDYTIAGAVITFAVAPASGDKVRFTCFY